MRAIAFLWLLAGGAEGRKPLFGQTGGDSNKCGAACEWYASAPIDGNADATWVLTKYDGNHWTKLDQYLMPGVTCQGNCPLTLKTGRDPGNPGYCR